MNIQKARAARKRAPLPWRSEVESRIIEQLVWQWWVESSGPSTSLRVNEKSEQQIIALRATGRVNPAPTKAKRPWAKLRVARFLGVSHTWVNKLVKRIEADPERMRRKMRAFTPASIEKLEQAREETRRQRERGWLRGPIRWRRVKVSLQGRKRKVMVPTRTAMTSGEWSVASKQRQMPHKQSAMPLPYRDVPEWAKGLLLPGDAALRHAQGQPHGLSTRTPSGRTPRPVPFAFRRRR